MFARRVLKNIFRRKSIGNGKTILITRRLCSQHQLDDSANDIIVSSPLPSINYPECSLDQYVWNDFNKWSSKVALVDGITERSVTYGQLRDRCRALAIRLQSLFQLRRGDVIGICLPNSIEFPTVCLAGSEAGFIVTTINPIYTAVEISHQLNNSNAQVLFALASASSTIQEAIELCKRPIKVVYVKEKEAESLPVGGIDFNELISLDGIDLSSLKTYDVNSSDVALLPYSSGTTGLSKGVQITHKNIVANSLQISCDTGNGSIVNPTTNDHQDVLPCVLPFFHIYGLTCTLISKMALGARLITLPRFTPDTYLNVLEKHGGTVLHLVPPIVIFMNNYDKLTLKHTETVKSVMSGAAPLGASDGERFRVIAPNAEFFQGYGLTEASPVVAMSAIGSTNYASSGILMPNTEGKIVPVNSENHRGVGPNISGELWVRGPQIMKGYHLNDKATSETLTSDGWLKTGDIGHYDENVEFYITDRLKELIKVKGFQVPPAELEEVLRDHPGIADAAVIGIPNHISGELPRAYVVRKDPELTEKEIKDYVATKVAEYKRIDGGVEFIDAIPKNATGKILRRELKKKFESSL